MIIHTWHRNTDTLAAERDMFVAGGLADAFADDDLDDDAAEICRMIELSGMIGLECGLLGDE